MITNYIMVWPKEVEDTWAPMIIKREHNIYKLIFVWVPNEKEWNRCAGIASVVAPNPENEHVKYLTVEDIFELML